MNIEETRIAQKRFKPGSHAGLLGALTLFATALVSTTVGEEWRVEMPGLAGTYPYGQSRVPVPFDIGCSLASVTAVRLEITGWYALGWWDGDDVENFYHGPLDSALVFELNPEAPWRLRWAAVAEPGTNGPFSCTIAFEAWGAQADWKFLENGRAEVYAWHPYVIGFGDMSTPPEVMVSSLTLEVEGERMFKILSLSRDGALSWTPMPTPGVVRVYSAPELTGPWSNVATVPSSNTCCTVTLAPGGNAGYIRAVYSKE